MMQMPRYNGHKRRAARGLDHRARSVLHSYSTAPLDPYLNYLEKQPLACFGSIRGGIPRGSLCEGLGPFSGPLTKSKSF